jgi:hypothetical protein
VRRFAPQLSAQLFCIFLVLFSVSNSQGQIPNRLTTQEQIQNRGWALESLRRQARLPPNAREKRLDQVSLRNDFRQLQIANNELMARVFKSPASQRITNKEIRSSLGEIKKLAERLGSSLGLPKIKSKAETEIALTHGLLQLDKAVMSFVDNPLFQQPKIFDAELASQAAGDLNDVLRLADVLRKLTKED